MNLKMNFKEHHRNKQEKKKKDKLSTLQLDLSLEMWTGTLFGD